MAVKEDISDKKDMERIKEDVDRIMRHDLKSPLNAIMGIPSLLLTAPNITEKQGKLLQAMHDAGRKMSRMIDMSLDMFKMESGSYIYRPQPTDPLSVLQEIIDENSALLTTKKITATILIDGIAAGQTVRHAPLRIWSEERLLYPLLANLIRNAIEASPDEESIEGHISSSDPIKIVITNNGTVPTAIREHFFEKYRTHGKPSGTGLGTYSAALLAKTMHYDIAMETSDSDNLTTLTITIPADQMQMALKQARQARQQPEQAS